jgi:hypothetical protein
MKVTGVCVCVLFLDCPYSLKRLKESKPNKFFPKLTVKYLFFIITVNFSNSSECDTYKNVL